MTVTEEQIMKELEQEVCNELADMSTGFELLFDRCEMQIDNRKKREKISKARDEYKKAFDWVLDKTHQEFKRILEIE